MKNENKISQIGYVESTKIEVISLIVAYKMTMRLYLSVYKLTTNQLVILSKIKSTWLASNLKTSRK